MWWASDNHNNMCHICAKELLDSNFNEAVICKISIFNEIDPNFTYSQKLYFFKYNWNFLDQPLLPYKFHGSDMWGMYFFIFANCEPLSDNIVIKIFSFQKHCFPKGCWSNFICHKVPWCPYSEEWKQIVFSYSW